MISVLIPTYKTPKMVAYTVAKLLEFSNEGEIEIFVVNNYPKDRETIRYLQPFIEKINYFDYPDGRLQSHGIGLDFLLENGHIKTDYFLMLESDAYPTMPFYEYYNKLIEQGCDAAYSILHLSGGLYGHPCGALYSKKVWKECKEYCDNLQYAYFPNMWRSENFDCHTMIHNSILDKVLENPEDYFELAEGYKPYSKYKALERLDYYKPTCGPFHDGRGMIQESVRAYGQRCFALDVPSLIPNDNQKIIKRVGYEPGQMFSYWMERMGKSIYSIPIEIKWMPDREGQQQEYSINGAGIYHCWGISSYTERPSDGVEDIYKSKRELPDKLYNTLPENKRIN